MEWRKHYSRRLLKHDYVTWLPLGLSLAPNVVNLTRTGISNTCCLQSVNMKPIWSLLLLTNIVADPLVLHPCNWGPNSEFICPGYSKTLLTQTNWAYNRILFHWGYDEDKSVPSDAKRVDTLVPKTNRVDFAIKRYWKTKDKLIAIFNASWRSPGGL